MRMPMRIAGIAAICSCAVFGQNFAGDWQGSLKAAGGLRLIVKIRQAAGEKWTASMFSIDQSPDFGAGIPTDSVEVHGSTVKFGVAMVRGSYEGTLSADGNTITGTWTQGAKLPLDLNRATPETAWKDPSPHTVRMVTVDKDVSLETLDWGGSGRALVLLAGLGNSAHIFDKFAPKLTARYHVYGITRRGSGDSSAPVTGYDADRLGDDVAAAIDQLKIERPVLAGHSIAGEELSAVAARHAGRVAGLIYLDAAYGYAFYDKAQGDLNIDSMEMQAKLEQLRPGKWKGDPKATVDELLAMLPVLERGLKERRKELDSIPPALLSAQASAPIGGTGQAILAGQRKYTSIPVPALAIYASPKKPPMMLGTAEQRKAYQDFDAARTEAQAKALEAGVPGVKVVRLANADHYVFLSNEADVLRAIEGFVDGLKTEAPARQRLTAAGPLPW